MYFFFTDECCDTLTIASLGQAGVAQGSIMGSYVYHMTDSNGLNVYLGPSNLYLFHHESQEMWMVCIFV